MRSLLSIIRWLSPLLFFGIISLFLWRGLQQDPHRIPSPLIDKPVPQFSLPSLMNPHLLLTRDALKGNLSILNVFASWCRYCLLEHAIITDIADSDQVQVFGLDYKDQRDAVKKWLKKYGNPYKKIIFDPQGVLAIDLGVYGTPETFIIDASGIIRYKHVGPLTPRLWYDTLLPRIKKIRGDM